MRVTVRDRRGAILRCTKSGLEHNCQLRGIIRVRIEDAPARHRDFATCRRADPSHLFRRRHIPHRFHPTTMRASRQFNCNIFPHSLQRLLGPNCSLRASSCPMGLGTLAPLSTCLLVTFKLCSLSPYQPSLLLTLSQFSGDRFRPGCLLDGFYTPSSYRVLSPQMPLEPCYAPPGGVDMKSCAEVRRIWRACAGYVPDHTSTSLQFVTSYWIPLSASP